MVSSLSAEKRYSVSVQYGQPSYSYNASGVELQYLIPLRLIRLDETGSGIRDLRIAEAGQQSEWTGKSESWRISVQSESGPWRYYGGLAITRWNELCTAHCTVFADPLERSIINNAIRSPSVAFTLFISGRSISNTNQTEQFKREETSLHSGVAYHIMPEYRVSPYIGLEWGMGLCEDPEPNNGDCFTLRPGLQFGFRVNVSPDIYIMPQADYSHYIFHYSSVSQDSVTLHYQGWGFSIATGYRW